MRGLTNAARGLRRLALVALLAAAACGANPEGADAGAPDGGFGCQVSFTIRPTTTPNSVMVVGEWDGFDRAAHRMADDGQGMFSAVVKVPPGDWGYEFLIDGSEVLDSATPRQKSVKGKTYSLITVADCRNPALTEVSGTRTQTRPSAGSATFGFKATRAPGVDDPSLPEIQGTLHSSVGGTSSDRPLASGEINLAGSDVTVALASLDDGDYALAMTAVSGSHQSAPLAVSFSIDTPASEKPTLTVRPNTLSNTRTAAGQGAFSVQLDLWFPAGTSPQFAATLHTPDDLPGLDFAGRPLSASEASTAGNIGTITLTGLADGKHRVTARLVGEHGVASDPLLLPFWIEATPFDFKDTALYMLMIDRFRDGDPTNNSTAPDGVTAPASFQGGDLQGVQKAIEEGYFDQLGIRAIWVTPWQAQPPGSYPDDTGAHQVMGYHGYWPVKAREVDARYGGGAGLAGMVKAAHKHGIRIIMDTVLNHVHEQHEYYQDPAKKGWFRTVCLCGDKSKGCDWEDYPGRLYCQFATYMPDINWTVPEASKQFTSDVLWWLDTFDVDGLRVDAVKHVEPEGIQAVASAVRARFETAGTKYLMFGESFTGDVGLINSYVGPNMLDAQLDFPLYFAAPGSTFATDGKGLQSVKGATDYSVGALSQYSVRFIGSHDSSRFITNADENQDNRNKAGNKWDNLPGMPTDQRSYDRLWLAFVNLTTIPGLPLIYYGDEYGEYGGSDPDNRHFFRPEASLNDQEKSELARMRKLLTTRNTIKSLSRGSLEEMWCNSDAWGDPGAGGGDLMAYARPDADPKQSVVVVINLKYESWPGVTVNVPQDVGWSNGTVVDAITGHEWSLTNGSAQVDVDGRSGVVLKLK